VDSFTAAVSVHDVAALRLTPLDGPRDDGWRPWHGQPMYAAWPESLVPQRKESWIGKGSPWGGLPRDLHEEALAIYPAGDGETQRQAAGGGGGDEDAGGSGGQKNRRLAAAA
jgi:hypothetical protein